MGYEYVPTTIMVRQEITLPTIGRCTGGCGRRIVPASQWRGIHKSVRAQIKKEFTSERSRGACASCYSKLNKAGDHIDLPSRKISDEIFAEEYNLLRQQAMTDYNIRISLGMTGAAFEKAIQRGKAAGRIEVGRSKASPGLMIAGHYHGGKLQSTRGVNG
jgi:hypothetical protein